MTNPSRMRRGFTMAELLVVIAIIALLASITIVVLGRVRKTADKARIGFQLQSLAVGIEAYRTDFNGLPVTLPVATPLATDEINRDGVRGARLLCKMLMGASGQGAVTGASPSYVFTTANFHQDGAAGLGFRVAPRSGLFQFDGTKTPVELVGKVYGPYVAVDKFELSRTNANGTLLPDPYSATEKYDDTTVLLDGNRNVILYYPLQNPQPPIQLQHAHVAVGHQTTDITSALEIVPPPTDPTPFQGTSMYLSNDNSCWLAPPYFRKYMGDTSGDMRIIAPEVAQGHGKYILWSAGPDGFYGPNPQTTGPDAGKFDDVTNFQGE